MSKCDSQPFTVSPCGSSPQGCGAQQIAAEFDKFREECGVMGLWGVPEASNLAYLGIYALQHRGQEGAGVVSLGRDGAELKLKTHKGLGLVSDVFQDVDFATLPGQAAVGHVRYTTAGSNVIQNVQPFVASLACGEVAIAHNGNLINADSLRAELMGQGSIFSSTSDTEIFLQLFARNVRAKDRTDVVIQSLSRVVGAYSLVILFEDRLLAVRDPNGFRPLVMGALGGGVVFASETCAFDLIGATLIREVEPGEVIEVTGEGVDHIKSYFPFKQTSPSPCVFEYIYFARPDSTVYGQNVYAVRERLGAQLAKECPVEADLVIPVPDSGVPAALGYAQASGIPFGLGLIRNHYVGRTFIEPKQSIRDFGVKLKLNPNREMLEGKRIIVIDDSVVRGTTSRKIVDMLRRAGAKEVHFRVSAPPSIAPCYYGIDTPSRGELVASSNSIDQIGKLLGADSIGYLSLEGMYAAIGGEAKAEASSKAKRPSFCDACFSNRYPVGTPEDFEAEQGELF